MKFTTALPIAVMAAASSPAFAANIRESVAKKKQSSTEVSAAADDGALSTSGRQLRGKGKDRGKANYPATPDDYGRWLLGQYYPANFGFPVEYYQVHLEHGKPADAPYYPAKLEIKPLHDFPSLFFEATLVHKINGTDFEAVEVMEGVGSFNPDNVDQIIFYSDHEFYRNSTNATDTFEFENNPQVAADVSRMQCSRVKGYSEGENIVCETYGQTYFGPDYPDAHAEGISTVAWAKSDIFD